MRTCWNAACVHPLVGLGGGWEHNVTKHYTTHNGNKTPIQKIPPPPFPKKRKEEELRWRFRYRFRQWNAHEKWNKLAQIFDSRVGEWRSPSAKVIPFCSSEGFLSHCRNPEKTERWLLLGGVWEKGPGPKPTPNKQIYWQTSQGLNSQDPELLSGSNQMSGPRWHVGGWDPGWTERSGCGWGEPSDTEEGGEGDPTITLFLTFGSPELPKEITVGYLKVKVALFVPSPMRCFNCNKSGHTSQRCKVAAGCGKDKHEGQCEGPKLCSNCNGPHASSAKDCPVWQKEEEIQCVRVEKRISFPEARQLVEVKMPTVISGGKTYAAAASTRRGSKSVQCQTSLTWVFSERPLRTTESNVRSSGGPGSVPTGTQASSGKARTVSADAWVPCESVKCSSETDRGSANPPKTASRGSTNFTKWHLRVLRLPSKAHLRVQQVS